MNERISRRQVLAAIALADSLPTPHMVTFRKEQVSLSLDTVADLHAWLPFFDMTKKTVRTQPYTHQNGPEAGKTTTLAHVYRHDTEWHGWEVHLSALDPVNVDKPLDEETRAQLATIAAGGTFTITKTSAPAEPVYPAPGSTIPGQPGYVVGKCEHRVAQSEWAAGFRTCERCPEPSHEVPV